VSESIQGVAGFGPDTLLVPGTTSYLDQLADAGMPNVFAIQFCHRGGMLWLGGYDPSITTGPVVDALMRVESNGDDVDWKGVVVGPGDGGPLDGGVEINIMDPAAADTLIDSGGTIILVPSATFTAIAGALGQSTAFQKIFGSSTWLSSNLNQESTTNCITSTLTPQQIDAELPTLTLLLSAGNGSDPIEVTLTASNSYLYYQAESETTTFYCQNLINSTTAGFGDSFYLGDTLMLNHVLVYDRANLRFGIAPAACAN
jgi:Eukaryotic aspartyl protease